MDNILYTTLDEESVFELEEKRSVFIGYAISVSTEEQAKEYIQKIKAKHHDARHNCSAYLLRNGAMRYSDDGEPQGTAGIPILEVIKKSGIVDVAVVVTRYFGGILLGAGGLVRAYSAAAAGALKEGKLAHYQRCTKFEINVDYSQYDKLTRPMQNQNVRVCDTVYNDKINVIGVISESGYSDFEKSVTEAFAGKLSVVYIENVLEKL